MSELRWRSLPDRSEIPILRANIGEVAELDKIARFCPTANHRKRSSIPF